MFATVEAVKTIGSNFDGANASTDGKLSMIVSGVNNRIQSYLSRTLVSAETTEVFDLTARSNGVFLLKSFPIDSVTSVTVNGDAVDSDDYEYNSATGMLRLKHGYFQQLGGLVVVYTGGMASSEVNLRASYPDIVYEANKQSLFEFNRMRNIESKSKDVGGSRAQTTEQYREFDLQPSLLAVLNRYGGKNAFVF